MSGPADRKTRHSVGKPASKKASGKAVTSPSPRAEELKAEEPVDRARQKDQARTLALLWGTHERAGRSGVTVRAVVRAAVELADKEGFEAVSMRRLADELEVGTMSLYTHVPGRSELTDLMVDSVYGELYKSSDEAASQPGGYRAAIRFIAERNKQLYTRHPWLLDIPLGRPALGPHMVNKYESELRALEGIGLTDLEMDSILRLVVLHVESTSRMRVSEQRAQQADGLTETEWWVRTEPLLHTVMTGQQFPIASRVGPAAGEAIGTESAADYHARFGVDVICEAVAALIAKKRKK